ncbi:MAG: hypothetical protein IH962_01805 [Chloroflexi bacterium]|nr:hypothetical protein [Chloroflexota bacterium]
MRLRLSLARSITVTLAIAMLAGGVTGTSNLHAGSSPGILTAGHASNLSYRLTLDTGQGPTGASKEGFAFPAAASPKLTLNPTTAVPNETLVIIGDFFSIESVAGGPGPNGAHQITGQGDKVISVGGTALTSAEVVYPIQLSSSGQWFASIVIPSSATVLNSSSLQITAKDTGNESASASVSLRKRAITLDKVSGRRGTTVKVDGVGFPAKNADSSKSFLVNLTYGALALVTVSPDSSGEFETSFTVPNTALIPSTNTVTAAIAGTAATATATHDVPAALITINPSEGPSGITFTVTGTNYPAFRPVTSLRIGVLPVAVAEARTTDKDGAFTVTSLVPKLPAGVKPVSVVAGGISSVTSFRVTEPDTPPTSTPAPTPTPAPAVDAAVALAPLTEGNNLIRVWHFNPATQTEPPFFGWSLYDPRPIFAAANTVESMVSGQFYWINVVQGQTVTLNGTDRVLFSGWNPVTW